MLHVFSINLVKVEKFDLHASYRDFYFETEGVGFRKRAGLSGTRRVANFFCLFLNGRYCNIELKLQRRQSRCGKKGSNWTDYYWVLETKAKTYLTASTHHPAQQQQRLVADRNYGDPGLHEIARRPRPIPSMISLFDLSISQENHLSSNNFKQRQ